MSKTIRSLNHLLVLLTCAASIWAWINLPVRDSYPIHWNARGEADGFSSKTGVLMVLSIMPITAIFTHGLMWFLTKVSSVQASIKESVVVYDIVWHSCLWLYLALNIIFARIYMGLVNGEASSPEGEFILRFIPVATGGLLIVIGNVMGKARQNKFVGVKTPWTLKSKSTWDATHRLTGWLWVWAGLGMVLTPFIFSPAISVGLVVGLILIISFVPMIYSYIYYQSASDKPR